MKTGMAATEPEFPMWTETHAKADEATVRVDGVDRDGLQELMDGSPLSFCFLHAFSEHVIMSPFDYAGRASQCTAVVINTCSVTVAAARWLTFFAVVLVVWRVALTLCRVLQDCDQRPEHLRPGRRRTNHVRSRCAMSLAWVR